MELIESWTQLAPKRDSEEINPSEFSGGGASNRSNQKAPPLVHRTRKVYGRPEASLRAQPRLRLRDVDGHRVSDLVEELPISAARQHVQAVPRSGSSGVQNAGVNKEINALKADLAAQQNWRTLYEEQKVETKRLQGELNYEKFTVGRLRKEAQDGEELMFKAEEAEEAAKAKLRAKEAECKTANAGRLAAEERVKELEEQIDGQQRAKAEAAKFRNMYIREKEAHDRTLAAMTEAGQRAVASREVKEEVEEAEEAEEAG